MGNGFGLSIVRRIIEAHKGMIEINRVCVFSLPILRGCPSKLG